MGSESDQILSRIRDLLHEQMAASRDCILPSTTLTSLGMAGDDAVEFFESYAREFGVDLGGLDIEAHFGPEVGVGPLALIAIIGMIPYRLWNGKWPEFDTDPVTVQQLIDAAQRKQWNQRDDLLRSSRYTQSK